MAVTTEMSLHDLVDLSLGTPEVVNYRGLRTLLLAIVDTLKLGEVKAEIKESEKKEILAEKKEQLASQDGKSSSRPVSRTGSRSSTELLELEKKVSIIETKLDTLNQLPSNEDLMERVRSAGSSVIKPSSTTSQAPVSEMWQLIQVQKKAQSNEEGVSKLMSMVEHLMGEFQELKGDTERIRQQMDTINNKTAELHKQIDSINNINSSLVEKLGELESLSQDQEKMNELQSNMEGLTRVLSSLPPVESIVTWPSMEDALKGIHQEPREVSDQRIQTSPMTGLSPIQPVVPTAHSAAQTLTPSPQHDQGQSSRPPSEAHPSTDIQGALKNIGELSGKHTQLEERVDSLEAQLSKKADLDEVERMLAEKGIPDDLSNMISEMKEGLDHFKESKEKFNSPPDLLDAGIQGSSSVSHSDLDELRDWLENHLKQVYDRLDLIARGDASDGESIPLSVPSDLENQVQQDLARLSGQLASQFSTQFKGFNDRVGNLETLLDSKLGQIARKLHKVKNFLQDDLKTRLAAADGSPEIDRLVLDRDTPSPCYDSDLLTGITSKIADLQAEADKLNQTCIHMLDEHNAKQTHIDALYDVVEKLQANKADKEDVTMEIDVKADKRALDSKISRNQFEGAVEEISRNLSNVMDQLSGHQSAWQQAVGEIKTDVDSKLDRLELDPLKAYLDKKIKAVNAKLVRKEPEMPEDAAGFRKQLIQKFHCISCDRPLDMTPQAPLASLPENKGLPGSRSGRPYTTFELEQIRTAQKRGLPGKNVNHYERALLEQEAARQRKRDIMAYLVHFEKAQRDVPMVRNCVSMGPPCLPYNRHMAFRSLLMDDRGDYFLIESYSRGTSRTPTPGGEPVRMQDSRPKTACSHSSRGESNQYHDVPDYFVTSRSCGGSHTLTYPHRRVARVTHLQHMPQSEEIPTPIANGKIETDVVGQDGHIYKARVSPAQMDHLPSLGKPKVQSARARSRLGSARVRSQTAPSMSDGLQSPRPSSSRQPSRPQSSRPMRPQSGRHSRSPPLTTPSTADGHPPTPSLSDSHGDQVSLNGSAPIHPSTVGEIAVELPGSGAPEPTEVPT